MAKTWVTKTTKLSDGSRMTTRMSGDEYLARGCLSIIFRPVVVMFKWIFVNPMKLVLGILMLPFTLLGAIFGGGKKKRRR